MNGFGQVHWPGNTDLTEVDLDECVQIVQFAAEVYPTKMEQAGRKPQVGFKLNKRAIITLNNMNKKQTESDEEYVQRLQRLVEKQGGKYIKYDKDN